MLIVTLSSVLFANFSAMRLFLLLSLILCLQTESHAQSRADSLLQLWNDETASDSSRVEAYITYLGDLMYSYPDSAFKKTDELLEFGQEFNVPHAKPAALNLRGVCVYVVGDYADALKHFSEAREAYKEIGNVERFSSVTSNMGNALSELGDYKTAIKYYKISLDIQEELEFDKAKKYTLAGIGGVYQYLGEHENALKYYQRVLKSLDAEDELEGFTDRTLCHISQIYMDKGELDTAEIYARQALEMSEKYNAISSLEYNLFVIGEVYLEKGDYSKAMGYFERSIKLSDELNHARGKVENLNVIGRTHLRRSKYADAISVCQESFDISESNGYLEKQIEACECLYEAYKNLGNKGKALDRLEKIGILNDSLDAQKTSNILQQMEFQKLMLSDSLANAEKERVLQEQHEEEVRKKNNTRNILLVVSVFILMLAGGIYSRLHYIRRTKAEIEKEKERSENLLLNILPSQIAEELKINGQVAAQEFNSVSVLFTDFEHFTRESAKMSAAELVEEIGECFKAFDEIISKYRIEKIKTIGDAYMAAGGLPVAFEGAHKNTVLAALEMQEYMLERKKQRMAEGLVAFDMRAGVHTGPIVAGIVGVKKFQYDIWGDTVNTSSRMETHGLIGTVNISQDCYEILKNDPDFSFEARGAIEVKGKGALEMYIVRNSG